jgi:colanic acid biosynthesis glycosyl transferase WcaI
MRILFLTQWFQPEPFFKGLPFAKALREKGHDVEVITGFPNYPGGAIYPGYRISFFLREIICGIPVHRVALYPSHDRSAFHRILNYLSFGLSAGIIGPFLVGRPDVIYVYNLVTLWPASIVFKRLFKCPTVYDITDLWPDSVVSSKMMSHPFLVNILAKYCLKVYRQASHLTTTTPGMRDELLKRGIPYDHMSVIYNWCDESSINNIPCNVTKEIPGKFKVVFAGTIGKVQALDAVLDAAVILLNDYPGIQFIFVGGGVEVRQLQQKAREKRLSNVTFLPQRPIDEIGYVLQQADVLLVHLKDDPLFSITIPSKTQAYMAVGKPVLMAVRGDAADLVREANAGVCCQPENPRSIADAVIHLHSLPQHHLIEMGKNSREFYENKLSLRAGVDAFERVFHLMLRRKEKNNLLSILH